MVMTITNQRIYLASRSPRRRELLDQVGVEFDTLLFRGPPRDDMDVSEAPKPGEDPMSYVKRIACSKAEGGARRVTWRNLRNQPVLAADTTLDVDGRIVGKPDNADQAREILRLIAGREHSVITAVALANEHEMQFKVSVNRVRFGAMTSEDIERYISTGEPFDKAGAYGVQGFAAAYIAEIHGSYSGIMGLPLYETVELLRHFKLLV